MNNIICLEVHRYAPELNRAILRDNAVMSCPGITSIKELRQKYFAPVKSGKYARIDYVNEKMPELNRTYSGYCANGYKSIQTTLKALKKTP